MAAWRFFQGLRGEWRWYWLASTGSVLAQGDHGFESLPACMADARAAGFDGHTFAVHAHAPGGAACQSRARNSSRFRRASHEVHESAGGDLN